MKNERSNQNSYYSKIALEKLIHENSSIKDYFDKTNNIDKNLPFINISLNKKNIQNYRNNFSYANRNNGKNYLNGNGYFSERIKDNDIIRLKGSINDNIY